MTSTSPKRGRRKLTFTRRLLVGGAILLGVVFFLSALANFISHDDLTEVAGVVSQVERKQYWEDVVLYLQLQGTRGRFKYEDGSPGFAEFESAVANGKPVRLLVESAPLQFDNPAAVYEAEVDGEMLIRFDQTKPLHNRESFYVMLLGPLFWFLGIWIWHRATRPLPTQEEVAAYEQRLLQIAEKNAFLFAVIHIVTKLRQWCEEIPRFGELAVVFFYFWILPVYMMFIYVTAQSYRALVSTFCISYWVLLVGLPIAAVTMPGFPGAQEYPALGETGSRLLYAYVLLNFAYGGAMWLWGTLMYEPEATVDQRDQQARAA